MAFSELSLRAVGLWQGSKRAGIVPAPHVSFLNTIRIVQYPHNIVLAIAKVWPHMTGLQSAPQGFKLQGNSIRTPEGALFHGTGKTANPESEIISL